jgi:hypothetical protein
MMMDVKDTKEYYLALPYTEKLKALRKALKINIQSYLVIAHYYLEAPIQDGGLLPRTIENEFVKGLKRRHYFNEQDKTDA